MCAEEHSTASSSMASGGSGSTRRAGTHLRAPRPDRHHPPRRVDLCDHARLRRPGSIRPGRPRTELVWEATTDDASDVEPTPSEGPREFVLFEVPPGWLEGVVPEVRGLDPGYEYSVWIKTRSGLRRGRASIG